jgi:hypothetical protein
MSESRSTQCPIDDGDLEFPESLPLNKNPLDWWGLLTAGVHNVQTSLDAGQPLSRINCKLASSALRARGYNATSGS